MFEIIGWLGMGILGTALIPQLMKTYKTKRVDDISLSRCILLSTGFFLSLIYSISLMAWPLIFNYFWALVTSLIFLKLYFKYRRK